jgi:hypothetical protein
MKLNNIYIVKTFMIDQWGQQSDWISFTFKNDPYTEPKWYFKSKEGLLQYIKKNSDYPKPGFYN